MPKPGETVRCDCNGCATEFEVTLEPKVRDGVSRSGTMPALPVGHCPFCGSEQVTTDEDE